MMGSSEVRKLEIKQICKLLEEKYDKTLYTGVLLCEGDENSIDVKLYSKVYPQLFVIPVGGWSDVLKLVHSIEKRNEGVKVFGLIDRDASTKKRIKNLREENKVYCTKLPFIENVICTPEMIKVLCKYRNLEYKKTIKNINETIMNVLSSKIRESLPINVYIPDNECIESVSIVIIRSKGQIVEKTVNAGSCLYTYRDKTIANIVAIAIGLRNRQDYYTYIETLLDDSNVSSDIVKVTKNYLPNVGK